MRANRGIYVFWIVWMLGGIGACNIPRNSKDVLFLKMDIPGVEQNYSEHTYIQEFRPSVPQALLSNPNLMVNVINVDVVTNSSIVEIRDIDNGMTRHGQVVLNSYVSFAKELVGTRGLEMTHVGENGVTFRVRYSKHSTTIKGE